jgi:hypothetical protein
LRRNLHRNGGCAARLRQQQRVDRGVRQGQPVDSVVLVEALVFRADDGHQGRWRDITELRPCQPPAVIGHAQFVDGRAVAIQQDAFRAGPVALHFIERRNRLDSGARDGRDDRNDRDDRSQPAIKRPWVPLLHGLVCLRVFHVVISVTDSP